MPSGWGARRVIMRRSYSPPEGSVQLGRPVPDRRCNDATRCTVGGSITVLSLKLSCLSLRIRSYFSTVEFPGSSSRNLGIYKFTPQTPTSSGRRFVALVACFARLWRCIDTKQFSGTVICDAAPRPRSVMTATIASRALQHTVPRRNAPSRATTRVIA